MAVANETIIHKMMEELKQAKEQEKHEQMVKHISNVRLLCDLLLEEGKSTSELHRSPEKITTEEMKAMLGKEKSMQSSLNKSAVDHDDANGDSLFDF